MFCFFKAFKSSIFFRIIFFFFLFQGEFILTPNQNNFSAGVIATADDDESSSSSANCGNFEIKNCEGPSFINDTCGIESPTEGNSDANSEDDDKTENTASCMAANIKAMECCQDPTSCLGGEALSTLKSINDIATTLGPGLASAAQGFGKDMAELCKTMQMMAAGGATVSLSASQNCKGSISSCKSTCDSEIAQVCTKYKTAKTNCEKLPNPPVPTETVEQKQEKEKKFKTEATPLVKQICQLRKEKANCASQKTNSDAMMQNISQMANSAISSEMCKMQAGIINDQKECKEAGGKWINNDCKFQKDKCEEQGGEWNPETKTCKPKKRDIVELTVPDPSTPTTDKGVGGTPKTQEAPDIAENPKDQKTEEDDEPKPNPGNLGSGGREEHPFDSPGIDLPGGDGADLDWESADTSQQDKNPKSSGRTYSGFGGSGFRANPGNFKRKKYDKENEDGNLSMGGGGFSGYGGGGNEDESEGDYANLGLSKKKLKELKDKEGVKRVPATSAGGAHQNIFERISKRFQSLCKNKLDCR